MLLPRIVIHLIHKLAPNVLTDLLEQLAEQMGQKRSSCDDTLVGIRITIVHSHLALLCKNHTPNHGGRDDTLACLQSLRICGLAPKLHVRKILCLEKSLGVCTLVLMRRGVLEMACKILNSIGPSIHAGIRTLLERRRQSFCVLQIIVPNQLGDGLVRLHTESPEEDQERKLLTESGCADCERISKPIELGGNANLKLLGRGCERLMERLGLHRIRVFGGRLLIEEDHCAIVGHLLLTQNRALASMDNEVAKRIVGTLAHLLPRHRVIVQDTEGRSKHNRNLAERHAREYTDRLVVLCKRWALICPRHETNVAEHLGSIREVTNTGLLWKHRLHTTGSLLNPWLQIRDVLKRKPELILILLCRLVLLVPHHNRSRGRHNERNLVAHEILK